MRVPVERLLAEFERVLLSLAFEADRARAISRIFAGNSLDGVYSHGLNRFPVFVQHVTDGIVQKDAAPVPLDACGAIERWDGCLGPGVLNASFCMERAVGLAEKFGIGCVALRNTNHWMRGGTYGWQAAEAGYIGICFTNTIAIMPPWGGKTPRLGNNPLVIAVPREGKAHVVLDMALSQFSFGKVAQYRDRNEKLPFPAGYDRQGELTDDPAEILRTMSGLPIGFWKGSGLSLMLDLLAAILSGGRSTKDITAPGKEYGVSQVFIAIRSREECMNDELIDSILAFTRSEAGDDHNGIRYPGEHTLFTREENKKLGVPVDEKIWKQVLSL